MVAETYSQVLAYHRRSKHRPGQYAAGPQTIDWDNQPDPFRRFAGTELIPLPLIADELPVTYADLFTGIPTPSQPLALNGIAQLLEMSLALSAWKQHGSARWSVRCNPSSGNLHPTEAYIIADQVPGLADGVYHYRADVHGLEWRCALDASSVERHPEGHPRLWLGLSSVHWREAWKYGERAWRYCQHDAGHALAGVSMAAAVLGWPCRLVPTCDDISLAALLGLDRDADFPLASEREHPDLLLQLHSEPVLSASALFELTRRALAGRWQGRANRLDKQHFYEWPLLDEIARLCQRPPGPGAGANVVANYAEAHHDDSGHDDDSSDTLWPPCLPTLGGQAGALKNATLKNVAQKPPADASASPPERVAQLFRRRRSAQAFDGYTIMRQDAFFTLLDHCLPRAGQSPWAALGWQPRLHLLLFVHRVEGLKPGLYCLVRQPQAQLALQAAMRTEFSWSPVADAPPHLPLYQLVAAKAERSASQLSCLQAIAGTSAFSLGMLGEFEPQLQPAPWRYRELFWEAGMIGQMLYLEAEAVGLQGTGIGCYFDDAVHALLGLQGEQWQSLYHFTVGGGVSDQRIISLPPYGPSR